MQVSGCEPNFNRDLKLSQPCVNQHVLKLKLALETKFSPTPGVRQGSGKGQPELEHYFEISLVKFLTLITMVYFSLKFIFDKFHPKFVLYIYT